MRIYLVRFVAACLLLSLTGTDGLAQRKGRSRSSRVRHSTGIVVPTAPPGPDLRNPGPEPVPIPQERTLRPELKKTKKVVIVPAPPPPPGPDPRPPYPKR